MEGTVISAAEAAEFGEFKRSRREAEAALTIKKLILDASRRETDRRILKYACEHAIKLGACAVLVSPVNVTASRRALAGSETYVAALVGGTGESLIATKKSEAKKAMKQGAKEIRLVLCYSALMGGNASYLKREIKKIRRAVKKCKLVISLEDHSLGTEEIARGIKAAMDGRADGICIRGETKLVLDAVRYSLGRLEIDVSGVENGEQLRLLFKAGAMRATTLFGEQIASDLYAAAQSDGLAAQNIVYPAPQAQQNERK